MANFNKASKNSSVNMIPNKEGATSYVRGDLRLDLISAVTSFVQQKDKFYETADERYETITKLIKTICDSGQSLFVLKLLVYTRTVLGLRSVSHFIAYTLLGCVRGEPLLRKAIRMAILRPDDMTEILSLWDSNHTGEELVATITAEKDGAVTTITKEKAKMPPNALRRAFKDVLESKFSVIDFARHAGENHKIKLRDIVRLARPAKNQDAIKALLNRDLPKAQSVEGKLAKGEKAANVVKELLDENKLGYMAALKNITKTIESSADDKTIEDLCNYLVNQKAIKKSMVLPFRFFDAYKEVKNLHNKEIDSMVVQKLLNVIEKAFSIASGEVQIVKEGERVAVVLDESGSMDGDPFKIASVLMASLLTKLNPANTLALAFSNNERVLDSRVAHNNPLEFASNLQAVGGGTEIQAVFNHIVRTKTKVDKIIIFSDSQMYSSLGNDPMEKLSKYLTKVKEVSPDVMVMFWNLEGYNTGTPIKLSSSILEVHGYSDKMLQLIPKMWKSKTALIEEIEKIEIV